MAPKPLLQAARLVVKPKPSTLSESFAIFRTLRTLGEVTKFVQHPSPPASSDLQKNNEVPSFEDDQQIVYKVEFSSVLQKLQDLILHRRSKINERDNRSTKSLKFKVEANGNHPDPRDLDPYNVRGLLDRKPSMAPSRFACRLTLEETERSAEQPNINDDTNQYTGPFTADTSSVLAKVFRQTDTPRHLVTGLAPKVADPDYPAGSKDEYGQIMNARLRRALRYARRKRAKSATQDHHDEDFSLQELYKEGVRRRRMGL